MVQKSYTAEIKELAKSRANKEGSGSETEDLVSQILEQDKAADPQSVLDKKVVTKAIEYVMFKQIRSDTLKSKKRIDGRKVDEIRTLDIEAGILPRTHGSAIFQRGLTQVLSIVTLGSPRMEQLIESAEGEEAKRYIHHYSNAPFSNGEAGRMGTPGRRDIGHGALAERALFAVIPEKDKFPYTIRVVSEILSQNGSSSMASTCGSTLALMDAGVPITKPVAGISIGMMSDGDDYVLLTDILGLEDFSGDMDFKVAGTDSGITAIQLDVKIPGLTDKQIGEILTRAKTARLQILEKMLSVVPEPKKALSEYAPKIETLQIPVDKIGEVIGPGGKIIKNIIAITGATVDVEDDGTVTVSGTDDEAVKKAMEWVRGITREIHAGEVFEGEVKRILPFGAFVEVLPGKEGMVHVSKMARGFVKNPEDVVHIGDKVKVRVTEIDDQGRTNLTMLLQDDTGGEQGNDRGAPREPRSYEPRGPRSGGFQARGPRSSGPRYDRSGDRPGGVVTKHPLAQQFERERRERRKPHY